MKKTLTLFMIFLISLPIIRCSHDGGSPANVILPSIIVNSLEDSAIPPTGKVTLRSALASAADGQKIVFEPSLDGGTIELFIVGEEHTILKGEVMGMKQEESGPVSYMEGYFDRDYGRSALYARKDVFIDASALASGITLSWIGGDANPARVLAVYGDLSLNNVSITGGKSVYEDISTDDPEAQPYTLARGGAIAVWGTAWLTNCKLYNNSCQGDFGSSRDRGAFGGGIYANIIDMEDCVISGNSVVGAGAAGGGVYSVTGYGVNETTSVIERSSITGNHISGLMAYGGGVYSDGGSIGNQKTIQLKNCTIARNLVDHPPLPPFLLAMGYWRGGGVYVSNGYLYIDSCTVVENEVYGVARTGELGKPNLAGGIAATIGNAHALEDMTIGHSVIAGNTVHPKDGSSYEHDIFTGSEFYFNSLGYNRIGVIDFSQILVPVGEETWASLCRKHYPKEGDQDGVMLADVLNLVDGITYSDSILSAGVDALNPVVLYYEPKGNVIDQVPSSYSVNHVYGEYTVKYGGTDNFLSILLSRLEDSYGIDATVFTTDFETFLQTVDSDDETDGAQPYTDPSGNPILNLAATQFYGPAQTWPKELSNYPYIEFWHRLDIVLSAEDIPGMGPELLGDDAWVALFSSGVLYENPDIEMEIWSTSQAVYMQDRDQIGTDRPQNILGDIGAVEIP